MFLRLIHLRNGEADVNAVAIGHYLHRPFDDNAMLSGRERGIYDLLPVHAERDDSSARHARCIDYRVDALADQNIVVSWIECHDLPLLRGIYAPYRRRL